MIDPTGFFTDLHLHEFARQELSRLRSEGLIAAVSPSRNMGGQHRRADRSSSFATATANAASDPDFIVTQSSLGAASYSREERDLAVAVKALKGASGEVHAFVEKGMEAGRVEVRREGGREKVGEPALFEQIFRACRLPTLPFSFSLLCYF